MYNIDWIRVIAFDLLILYHVGMIFVPWDYHLKNNVISGSFTKPMMLLNQWRLPILFVISGMGTYFALSHRTGGLYIKERLTRLFIPLLFGILIIIPPQVYFERLSQGNNFQSIFHFYPNFFKGIYPKGNLSWGHLWFVVYLLFYSLLLTPLFLYIKRKPDIKPIVWLSRMADKFPVILYLFIIPLIIIEVSLERHFPPTLAFWGDWFVLSFYGILFFYGFLLVSLKDKLWIALIKGRRIFLLATIIFITIFFFFFQYIEYPITCITRIIYLWSMILLILAYSAKYLNKPSRLLSYRNKAVYPFYILHQTVLLVLAYYLINVEMNILFKFLLLTIGTFGISWLVYECLLRRIKILRPLFGLKK